MPQNTSDPKTKNTDTENLQSDFDKGKITLSEYMASRPEEDREKHKRTWSGIIESLGKSQKSREK